MPLTEAHVLLTPVRFDTDAQSVADHTHKQTVQSSGIQQNLYSLACTPIKYVKLCNALSLYSVVLDKIHLIHGFKYGFMQAQGHTGSNILKSERLAPQLVEQKLD